MATHAAYLRSILLEPCLDHRRADKYLSSSTDDDPWRIVHDAAKEGAEMRYSGVTAGLYLLKQLKPFCRLKEGIPTIRRRNPVIFQRAADEREFLSRFREDCPILADFDLKRHGFCIAGGSICGLVMSNSASRIYADYDLFLVGHSTEDSARRAINTLRDHIFDWMSTNRPRRVSGMRAFRTVGCVTFLTEAAVGQMGPIQVILRLYSTIAEVVHSFDLGSSAFLWDGEHVWLTALGKLAAEHGVNVLNLSTRRASLEMRIAKYFDRGFDLVLPGLDVWRMAMQAPYHLPHLLYDQEWQHRSCCACTIKVISVTEVSRARDHELECSDYAHRISYSNTDGNELHNALLLGKMMNVSSDTDDASDHDASIRDLSKGLCGWDAFTRDVDIFAIQPTINSYRFLDRIWRDNAVAISAIFGKPSRDWLEVNVRINYEEVRDRVVARVAELNRHAVIPFAFMPVEANTSLIGPFSRRVLTPMQWFGEAYLPVNEWNMALNGALALAAISMPTYELLWILQWAYPAICALNEALLIQYLTAIRNAVVPPAQE